MTDYIHTDGTVKTVEQVRKDNPNTSFPRIITQEMMNALGYSIILYTPQPTASSVTKLVVRDGVEKNSKSYIDENNYCVKQDQIFSYKRNNKWLPVDGYCFVKPVKNKDIYSNQQEKKLVGVIKQVDTKLKSFGIKKNDLVGFIPNSERCASCITPQRN